MRSELISLASAMALALSTITLACADYSSNGSAGTGGAASVGGSAAATGGSASSTGGQPSAGGTGNASTGGSNSNGTGGSSSTSCTSVTPCGGDIAGTWNVKSSCLTLTGELDMSVIGIDCTRGQITSGSLSVSGSITLDSGNHMYTDNTTTTGDINFTLIEQCLHWSGTVTTCDGLARSGLPSIGFDTTSTCTPDSSTGGCTCHGHVNQQGWMAMPSLYANTMDIYTTSGNKFDLTSGAVSSSYNYCVSGTTMTVTPASTLPVQTGTIVLQKQ